MDFFGIGSGEVLLILIVALLIWGPGRVVEIGRTLGKTANAFRKAAFDLTNQISKEIEEDNKGKEHSPKPRSNGDSPAEPQNN